MWRQEYGVAFERRLSSRFIAGSGWGTAISHNPRGAGCGWHFANCALCHGLQNEIGACKRDQAIQVDTEIADTVAVVIALDNGSVRRRTGHIDDYDA